MRIRVLATLAFLLTCWSGTALLADPPATPAPHIEFAESALVARGLTAGGDAIVFGVARQFEAGAMRIVQWQERLSDDDRDGSVSVPFKTGVDPQSVWVVADLTTGTYTIAEPQDSPFAIIPVPLGAVRSGSTGHDGISDHRQQLRVLVVRAGEGAWQLRAGEGGAGDADGSGNGELTVTVDQLLPIGDSPTLTTARFNPQDLVVAIDTDSLQLYVARIRGPRA